MSVVRNGFNTRRARTFGRMAGAALMLVLWAAALVFASSTRLHSQLCADAKESSHDCVFTSVAQGHFSASPVLLTVAPDVSICFDDPLPAQQEPAPSVNVWPAPGRAPPSPFVVL
jgi:hypothetical protein